jgi:hypothetical protein
MVVVGALMYAGSAKAYCDWWWHTNYKYEEQREQNLTLAARAATDDVRDRIKEAQAQLDRSWADNERECAALTAPKPQEPQQTLTPEPASPQLTQDEQYRLWLKQEEWLAERSKEDARKRAEEQQRSEARKKGAGPDLLRQKVEQFMANRSRLPPDELLLRAYDYQQVAASESERALGYALALGDPGQIATLRKWVADDRRTDLRDKDCRKHFPTRSISDIEQHLMDYFKTADNDYQQYEYFVWASVLEETQRFRWSEIKGRKCLGG